LGPQAQSGPVMVRRDGGRTGFSCCCHFQWVGVWEMVMGKTILKWPLRCFGCVGVLIFFLFLMPTLGLGYSRTEAEK